MVVRNASKGTVLGEAIEVASTAVQRAKGLLGREWLEDGQGLLFKGGGSIHTFFMRFPIDVLFLDKRGRVLKASQDVHPFKLVAAPFRARYVLELPKGAIVGSATRVGDLVEFEEEEARLAA
jgi:uncharacterized membrane protein (UPF0127 family)